MSGKNVPIEASGKSNAELLHSYIEKLRERKYFGKIEITFQDGHFVRMRKEDMLIPSDIIELI